MTDPRPVLQAIRIERPDRPTSHREEAIARLGRRLTLAGLPSDRPAHRVSRIDSREKCSELGEEIQALLIRCGAPSTGDEIEVVQAVPEMTAFACAIIASLPKDGASSPWQNATVQRAFSLFVVASAIFDHICDEDPLLLPALRKRVTPTKVRAAMSCDQSATFSDPGDPLLVRYLTALVDEFARVWAVLLETADVDVDDDTAQLVVRTALDILAAETAAEDAGRAGAAARDVVWEEALMLAALLVSVDQRLPEKDRDAAIDRARAVGRLLSLVDDVVDLEHDWLTGSSNRLLARFFESQAARGDRSALPWTAVMASAAWHEHLQEAAGLVERIPPGRTDDVAAWLYTWFSS